MPWRSVSKDWYFIAEQPAPAPRPARPEGRPYLRIGLLMSWFNKVTYELFQ